MILTLEENIMKATGIVRRIDELGRVVIPKEIRRTMRIREGESLEIFTNREGEIVLKKYSPIGELGIVAQQYAESLAQATGQLVCVTDMDQVVASAGSGRKEFQDQFISKQLRGVLNSREQVAAEIGDKKYIYIVDKQSDGILQEVIDPIISEGDVIGAVILLARDEKKSLGEIEKSLALCAAIFLGKQMEQ